MALSIGLALCAVLQLGAARLQAVEEGMIEKGVTAPSSRKELAFPSQGIIAKVNVKEGDVVTPKQPLMEQDARIELKRLEGLKLDADRSLIIRAKEATLDNKKVELQRRQKNYDEKAATEFELLQAKLDVVLAIAEVDVSKHEATVKTAEAELQQVRVDLMVLPSPVAGIVERLVQSEGEVADINKPSIIIVKNDPLYIDVKTLPTAIAQRFKKGDTLQVRYPNGEWQPAVINLLAPVADARAGTQSIRLEMANPENRSTGLEVEVRIPESAQTALR
ncbi:MAG: hypothetical protein H7144_06225 [Burkholderiales bacterium]|nr:hypothetical protein [Phycisphaerae bacterium]